jgi:hypothetical protein
MLRMALAALAFFFGGQHAALRFAGLNPLAVTGQGFTRGEKVRVTAHAGGSHATVRVRADGAGRLRATFRGVTVATCDGVGVDAVGAHGERASVLRRDPAC